CGRSRKLRKERKYDQSLHLALDRLLDRFFQERRRRTHPDKSPSVVASRPQFLLEGASLVLSQASDGRSSADLRIVPFGFFSPQCCDCVGNQFSQWCELYSNDFRI